jgi:hypothetical protein
MVQQELTGLGLKGHVGGPPRESQFQPFVTARARRWDKNWAAADRPVCRRAGVYTIDSQRRHRPHRAVQNPGV